MNDQPVPPNAAPRAERPPIWAERQPDSKDILTLGEMAIRSDPPNRSLRRVTLAIVIAFWLIQYGATSFLVHLMDVPSKNELYAPRALVSFGGFLISLAMIAVQDRLTSASLAARGMIAALMAFIAPAVSAAINFVVFYILYDFGKSGLPGPVELFQDYLIRLWVFAALSPIILALAYAADIRERERRISVLQQLAHSAQLRALRNQLNPHFLFNALNSIVALIGSRRTAAAETMTENLADFLRLTLALDPRQLIPLAEELRLQQLYLSIEEIRFPGRLEVVCNVPEGLRDALVPSLITQPLIENAIKYSVARSTRKVTLRITARAIDGEIELVVADCGGDADAAPIKGSRLGLANVAERLQAHFGDAASLVARPGHDGGFRNELRLPLRRAA